MQRAGRPQGERDSHLKELARQVRPDKVPLCFEPLKLGFESVRALLREVGGLEPPEGEEAALVGFKGHDALLGPADPVGHPDVVRGEELGIICCLICRRGRGATWARRPLLLVGRKIPGRIGSGHRGWYHSVDFAEGTLPSRRMSELVLFEPIQQRPGQLLWTRRTVSSCVQAPHD